MQSLRIARFVPHCAKKMSMSSGNIRQQQSLPPRAEAVLKYWLGDDWQTQPFDSVPDETRMKIWYRGGEAVDAHIRAEFSADLEALVSGELATWKSTPYGALAGIIVGDQFSRNAYRKLAKMFATDDLALQRAQELVRSPAGLQEITPMHRMWVAHPFMHSENISQQQECKRMYEDIVHELQSRSGNPQAVKMAQVGLDYAIRHLNIVEKWGRFPHRNAVLGRESTPEEARGLADGSIEGF